MNRRITRCFSILLLFCLMIPDVYAQLGKITFDLEKDKPAKFKTKTLKSEKTGQKKFTIPRRFIQNTVSHYNYYFNANNKINSVIERARLSNKDDYSLLLPYYSFSLNNTAAQKNELDSVIYKATAGVLLHDLRSDWVDNLYLLIGKAYYLKKDFDSASMTFQFINYNLFPRKKKSQDDQLIVGSNDNGNNNGLSISSREKRGIIDKAFTRPPSRNDALVWQIRSLIEMNEFSDAAGLINTLQNDPQFPERLHPALEEVEGYWFFKQKMYDSAVTHIQKSLPNSIDLQDKARREYLLAQLYEMNHIQDTSSEYYERAIRHTTDPLMDIYANLNMAKMRKSSDPAGIDNSIGRLLRMARKDKFDLYRDIIFYSAAQLALEKPDTTAAVAFFKKSVFYNQDNISNKNKAFLTLAEICYQQKNYKQAYAFYDSLQTSDSTLSDLATILARRSALRKVVKNIYVIEREDSLQSIAALSNIERDGLLKKLSKRLQKERGIKDEGGDYTNSAADFFNTKNQSSDIFANNETKGDWYFYNTAVKSSGFKEFKSVWGKRQNEDNWRRGSNVNQNMSRPDSDQNNPGFAMNNADPLSAVAGGNNGTTAETGEVPYQTDISFSGLLKNVPMTKPMLDSSNAKIATSLFQLGKDYQDLLEDYHAAIDDYLQSLKRFPDSLYHGELYLNLSYCYRKIGNLAQADYYKNRLLSQFAGSKFTQYALHPESFKPSRSDTAATKRYDNIYNLFIEGKFDEALKEKQLADSSFGNSYWTPQLLYIQSVYYVRQRQDSAATNILNQIILQFPKSPMRQKAATMISVLDRRDSIEHYLTNLKVVRKSEDSSIVVFDDTRVSRDNTPRPGNNTTPITQKNAAPVTAEKAVINPAKKLPKAIKNATFTFDPNVPQYVLMVLDKVDPVYINEARNAFIRYNREKFYALNLQITKDTLDSARTLLVFSEFENADAANKYRDRLKINAPAEISWLPANKYTFYIISAGNLELLKENKNLGSYIELLNKQYPGKF
jgi:tetratricopeptide (TPR) repeat protein